MRIILILIGIVIISGGCLSDQMRKDTMDPTELMYPSRVEWDDPEAVLQSYYGAKKRGDWEKAFDICDFEQVLSRSEANKIRRIWKKDSESWPDKYAFTEYYVTLREKKGDTAVVAVIEVYPSRDRKKQFDQSDYEEKLRLYGKKWKLVVAEELKALENELERKKKELGD